MEREAGTVLQDDNGAGTEGAVQANAPEPSTTNAALQSSERSVAPPQVSDGVPPELQPDADGNPPKLTEQLLRKLRGKYFTVRHPLLTNCGHRLDMVNEPRHRHCENCYFQWFNTHPQLVETADQFYRTHGVVALTGMRGKHFVKMFVRYMATVIHFMKESEALKAKAENEAKSPESPSTEGELQPTPTI
jgi:hypothetical protein